MSYPQAIFLAIVQALTEFLPISSSGHLVIFQKLLGFAQPPILFDVLVHMGTLLAVVVFLHKELAGMIKGAFQGEKASLNLVFMIAVGTVPAAMAGLFLQKYIGLIFNSLKLVSFSFLITAGLLFSSRLFMRQNRRFSHLKWLDALWIGLFQALAILPGVSRSGSTIVAGLWRQLDRETAFRFSFFVAIPAIVGATVLQIPDIASRQFSDLNQSFLGMAVAAVVGYFALVTLKKVLLAKKLWFFGFYCFFLGLILMVIP